MIIERIMNSCYTNMEITARMNIDTGIRDRTAARRLVWCADVNLITIARMSAKNFNREYVLTWIDEHTTGRFYLGGNQVGFEDEQDEIMFKLGFINE